MTKNTINDFESAKLALVADFPWIAPHVIRVSKGLTPVIKNLLMDVNEIIGNNYQIDFLRITEEPSVDMTSLFQRKLCISIQSNEKNDARNRALLYAANNAINAAPLICCSCSHKLEFQIVREPNEDAKALYTFLPPSPANKQSFISGMHICPQCATPIKSLASPNIHERFPWIRTSKEWTLDISDELSNITTNLLADIEKVMGDSPIFDLIKISGNHLENTLSVELKPHNADKEIYKLLSLSAAHAIESSQIDKQVKIEDLVFPDFEWSKPLSIKAPSGLKNVTRDFLIKVEEILGNKATFDYFDIRSEHAEEWDGQKNPFCCGLVISMRPRKYKEGNDNLLVDAIKDTKRKAVSSCCLCSNELSFVPIYDEQHRRLFSYLDKRTAIGSRGVQMSHVCLSCATPVDPEADSGYIDDVTRDDTPFITMFDDKQVDAMERGIESASRDNGKRIASIVKRLRNNTSKRRLAVIPENWREYCDDLELKFPNFIEVIACIRNQLALSSVSDSVFRLPPLLLVGSPGIGKTELAMTISNDFNAHLEIIDMSSAQSGSSLTGSEAFWSNSEPGKLFNAIALGEVANPIIILDEVDKAKGDDRFKPLSGLHQLLEPRQAKSFHDLSFPELNLDASNVIWIATANSIETLEEQIIDRFTVFKVSDPSPENMKIIANNQYQRFIDSHPSGDFFDKSIKEDVLVELAKHHPRKVRKILDQAFGLAACDNRNYLTIEDTTAIEANETKKRIGF